MTPTTQPVEPSREADEAALAVWKAGYRNGHFTENTITNLARIIDSSFAELRRERDAVDWLTRPDVEPPDAGNHWNNSEAAAWQQGYEAAQANLRTALASARKEGV